MKQFIIKFFIFMFLIIALTSLPIFFVQSSNIPDQLLLPQNVTTIFMGDSHTQCAVDDKFFPNSLNISRSAESYLYSFYKIKYILKLNPQIKNVVLGFSYHNLGAKYDDYIKLNNSKFKLMCKRYLLTYDPELFFYLLKINPIGIVVNYPDFSKRSSSLLWRHATNNLRFINFPFIGSFLDSDYSNINDSTITYAINGQFYTNSGEYIGISEIQTKYFYKIIDYFSNSDVNLILINPPVNKDYYDRVPKQNIKLVNSIADKFEKIVFLNHSHMSYPDNYWRDGDHLNSKSAKIYTQYLYNQFKELQIVE